MITNVADVNELMNKQSRATADRPHMHIADAVTNGLNMGMAQYTEQWRTHRKAAHTILMPQAVARHLPIQNAEAMQLLQDLLRRPRGFYNAIGRYASSVILSVLYGTRAPRYESPATAAFFKAQHEWECLLEPGATPPIDMIPLLKYVPERFAKWKRNVRKTRDLQRAVYFGLLDKTKERMQSGEANGSYMEEILARKQEFGLDYENIGYLGGALIEGGAGSTASYLQSLLMVLTAYPNVQKKAQEEVDRVVGQSRMPKLEDLEHMPYLRAITLELHRFRPVAPLMIPHATITPVEYKGYTIPAGTTIFINAWGIFHDPELYDDPETFNPDRYVLTENGTKPGVDAPDLKPNFIFGVGRRVCPGVHLAQNSVNINVMNLVWAFNYTAENDAAGRPEPPDVWNYHKGVLSVPKPFKCKITPRTPAKAEMIERGLAEATETFEKFEYGLEHEDKEFVERARA